MTRRLPRAKRARCFSIFGEIGDGDDLVAMVKKYAMSGQAYDQRMDRAVYAVAIKEVPVSDGSNSYYIHPAPVGVVRKTLFGLLNSTIKEAGLASNASSRSIIYVMSTGSPPMILAIPT